MTESWLFLVIIVALMIVLVAVLALPTPRQGPLVEQSEALVRWSAVGGISALSTALLYLVQAATDSIVAGAVGDGLMVAAAWAIWAALGAVNDRGALVPVAGAVAAATSVTVSMLVPETAATAFKLVLVAVGCLGFGVEGLRGRLRASAVDGWFVGVGFGFGAYTLARVVVITWLGTDSVVYQRAFTTVASSFMSVIAIAITSTGVVLLVRHLIPRRITTSAPASMLPIAMRVLSEGATVGVYHLDIADLGLIRHARGAATAQALQDGLVEAATSRFPSGVLAVPPSSEGLVVLDAEHPGAQSAAADLVARFDTAVARGGIADLAEVEVERFTARTLDELAEVLAPLGLASGRPSW